MITNYWNGFSCDICNGKACTVCTRKEGTKVITTHMSEADYRLYLRKLFNEQQAYKCLEKTIENRVN